MKLKRKQRQPKGIPPPGGRLGVWGTKYFRNPFPGIPPFSMRGLIRVFAGRLREKKTGML